MLLRLLCLFAMTLSSLTPVFAELPKGYSLDEGFTWFKAENTQDSADGKPVDLGFYLVPEYRIWGKVPKRSAFRSIVMQGGEELANIRCEGEQIRDFSDQSGQTIALRTANYCKDARTKRIKAEGQLDVDLYYIDGRSSEEFLIRSFILDVRKVERVRGMASNPEWDSPRYYISRHAEVAHAILQQRERGQYLYGGTNVHGIGQYNHVLLYFSNSPTDDMGRYVFDTDFIRCRVNGEPIDFGQDDRIHVADWRNYDVMHVDRDLEQYKRGSPYKERIRFKSYAVNLPLTFGEEFAAPQLLKMQEYPGAWDCVWESQGNVLRSFRWSVDAKGKVGPHPEEEAGLTLAPRTHLIGMGIPEGGSVMDERLVGVAAAGGGFYGRPWQSPEMQEQAAQVPNKGSPWPVRSGVDRDEVGQEQREAVGDQVGAARSGSTGGGLLHSLVGYLLSLVLIVMGLYILRDKLPPQLKPALESLQSVIGKIALAAIALALLDFSCDLMILRPLIGDIVPQLAALLAGLHLAHEAGESLLDPLEPYRKKVMDLFDNKAQAVGFLALAMGLFHLLMGGLLLF